MSGEGGLLARWALVLTALFLLQVSVFTDLRLAGVHPDLLLLIVITAALTGGATRGAEIGFVAGLASDLLLSGNVGTAALCFAIVGFAVGTVAESVIHTTRVTSITIVVLASAVGVLLYAALGQLLGQHSMSDPRLFAIVGIVSLVNGALCLPALAVSRWAEGAGLRTAGFR